MCMAASAAMMGSRSAGCWLYSLRHAAMVADTSAAVAVQKCGSCSMMRHLWAATVHSPIADSSRCVSDGCGVQCSLQAASMCFTSASSSLAASTAMTASSTSALHSVVREPLGQPVSVMRDGRIVDDVRQSVTHGRPACLPASQQVGRCASQQANRWTVAASKSEDHRSGRCGKQLTGMARTDANGATTS